MPSVIPDRRLMTGLCMDIMINFAKAVQTLTRFIIKASIIWQRSSENEKKFPAVCSCFFVHQRSIRWQITNTPADGSYGKLKTFWEKDCDDVLEFAKDLDTSIGLYQSEGRVYLVRNLVDSATYRPWGLLVHRLNLNYCFYTGHYCIYFPSEIYYQGNDSRSG